MVLLSVPAEPLVALREALPTTSPPSFSRRRPCDALQSSRSPSPNVAPCHHRRFLTSTVASPPTDRRARGSLWADCGQYKGCWAEVVKASATLGRAYSIK
jgi:hypothetical protein